jgi:outer membrane protein TolC
MMRMNRIALWLVGLAVLCGFACAQQGVPLTLQDALRRALQYNGDIQSALAKRRAAEAELTATRTTLFPQFEWNSSSIRTRLEQGGTVAESTTRQDAIALDWLLFDAGRREARIRQASRSHELARQSARGTLRALLFETARAYYEVLRRQELLRVADETVQRAQTLLDVARTQAEVGTAPAKDVLQAEADLANARGAADSGTECPPPGRDRPQAAHRLGGNPTLATPAAD